MTLHAGERSFHGCRNSLKFAEKRRHTHSWYYTPRSGSPRFVDRGVTVAGPKDKKGVRADETLSRVCPIHGCIEATPVEDPRKRKEKQNRIGKEISAGETGNKGPKSSSVSESEHFTGPAKLNK